MNRLKTLTLVGMVGAALFSVPGTARAADDFHGLLRGVASYLATRGLNGPNGNSHTWVSGEEKWTITIRERDIPDGRLGENDSMWVRNEVYALDSGESPPGTIFQMVIRPATGAFEAVVARGGVTDAMEKARATLERIIRGSSADLIGGK